MSETQVVSGLPKKARTVKREVELQPARVFQCVNFECGCMFQNVLRGDAAIGISVIPCYAHTSSRHQIESTAKKALGTG